MSHIELSVVIDHILESIILVHEEIVLHVHGRVEWEMLEGAGE